MSYVSLSELRAWLGVHDTADDTQLALALDVATRKVDDHCGRTFASASVAAARTLRADDPVVLRMAPGWDIQSTSGLIVKTDDNDDGTFETTWTSGTDFEADSGIGYDGAQSWPHGRLVAVGARLWPTLTRRRAVQITALWGWAAVPDPVKQATLILAAEAWKVKDAPFGVAAFADFGPMRVRDNPTVAQLLARYRHPVTTAVIA